MLKFDQFNEQTITFDKDGNASLKEYEIYRDVYPMKYKSISFTENKEVEIFGGDFVWVVKKNDNIVALFSSDISEEAIKEMFS